jgi:hypothetical protein
MAPARSSGKDFWRKIWPGFPQNILTRAHARSCEDLSQRSFYRITTFSVKDLRGITQGPLRRCQPNMPDLHQIFSHRLSQTYTRSCQRISSGRAQNRHKILVNIFIYHWDGPLKVQHINLARLWCKRDNCFMRVCAVEMHIDISKNRFTREFTGKGRAPSFLCDPAQSTWSCAIDMHMDSHGHVRRAVFTRQFSRKMPRTGTTVLREPVRSCAVETHMLQKPFYATFWKKMSRPKTATTVLCVFA